ncbi:odorant receptor 43a-like [Vespa mandarinia]|uniref:odorant receptor 43a-like n=1 Tax=Vespa mandarinia TaxID=7446 RepID=UPI0016182BE6|nr:odorant receptor 43a-like [Vespa mandarinia]
MAFEDKDKRDMNEKLIRGIKIHKMALRYLNDINRHWEFTFLIQCGLVVLIITIDFLHILHLHELSKETFLNTWIEISYIISSMLYIFIIFYVGQKVQNGSMKFYITICSLPWYDLPIKFRKILLLLILKSRKESYISVGKSYKMSYEFYAKIVRMAMSYTMMIRSLQ